MEKNIRQFRIAARRKPREVLSFLHDKKTSAHDTLFSMKKITGHVMLQPTQP